MHVLYIYMYCMYAGIKMSKHPSLSMRSCMVIPHTYYKYVCNLDNSHFRYTLHNRECCTPDCSDARTDRKFAKCSFC